MTGPIHSRKIKTREQALREIERISRHFDIQLEEDFLLEAIAAMQERHAETLDAFVDQAVGAALFATGKEFVTINPADLMDTKPFDVRKVKQGASTRYQLIRDKNVK